MDRKMSARNEKNLRTLADEELSAVPGAQGMLREPPVEHFLQGTLSTGSVFIYPVNPCAGT